MKKGFTTFLSALKANTPPCKKGLSSLRFLSIFLILFLAVGNAWGAEVIDLVAISENHNVYFEDIVSAKVTAGTLIDDSHILSVNGNSYATSKGTDATVNKLYCLRVKSISQDVLAFKVSGTCTLTLYADRITDRTPVVNSSISTDGAITAGMVTPTNSKKGYAVYSITDAGTYYVIGSGSDCFLAGLEFSGFSTTPECPSGLTISGENEYLEGETIELTAALTAGNGDITYNWYKGADLTTAKAAGSLGTGLTFTKASCTTADADNYFCVASKTDCDDVESSSFAVTVAEDSRCFVMPAITSTPSNIGSISVTGGTLADVGDGKTLKMQSTGIGFGNGNAARLKVTLTSSSIVEGTKITIDYNNASSDGSGVGLYNENYEHQVIDETGVTGSGSFSHTFTAEEAANYADVFLIDRNSTGKGMIIGSITVENCGPAIVKHTITLDYNDGATANSSILVVDETTATQPADPERGKYTFLGWYNGETLYDWATPVTSDLILTAKWQDPWSITFDSDGGSTVETITVKHNTVAEQPEDPTLADHDFNGWFYGDPAVAFDWTAAVTQNYALTAQWQAAVAKYDVQYYDGETLLGTELQVRVDQHPTAEDIETNKPLYTFVGWYSEPELTNEVSLSDVTPSEGLKLYGKWTKVYGKSVDFEAYILDNTGEADDEDKAEAYVTSQNYALSTKTNTTFDANNSSNNGAYAGLKIKNSGTTLSWNVEAGKVVDLKAGVMVANGSLSINGGAATTIDGGSTDDGDNFKTHLFYSDVEALYVFTTSSGSAEVIKAITIHDPYTVTFNANGGNEVAAMQGKPSITLPTATNGTQNFAGWWDAAEGGKLIGMNGEEYTPTANVELFAHWEALSTVNTLSDLQVNGATVEGFASDVHTYYIVLPYGTDVTNLPKITTATPTNANATVAIYPTDGPAWTDEYGCYRQQANVTPQDHNADIGYNDIRITIAPKDGVSIIKVATTGGTNKTVTGLYAGEGDVNLSNNTKMDNGKYIGFTLDGTTLQAGDRINVHTTAESTTGGSHIIFYDNMTDKNELYDTGEIGGEGDNIFTINAAMVGQASAYVYRSSADNAHKWNGYVDYIEVTRPMNPVLTAITINGEAGTINESAKTVAVELQPGYDLAALTIVPTIVSNTAEADVVKTVESNGGAWVIGDNTYRLTDKDGDYTDYTITLSVGVLKHTVSFNTHGGSTIDDVEVVDGQKLAAAPADPTKEDYLFQGWAETEDGSIVDVTSFTISADKEFHAIWAPDGAIKLLDGSTVNTTNFITGVTAEKVTINDVEYNCVKFAGTVSDVNGVKDPTRVIAYNATTEQTKIQLSLYNNSTNSRTVKVKGLVEGASSATEIASIELSGNEKLTTEYYEFNDAANRTIYIFISSSAGDVRFLQVKVIESGSTTLPNAGEIGYSLNLNKGRIFGQSTKAIAFEGLNATFSSDYQPLNSSYAKLKSTSMSFTTTVPLVLQLTTNNNKTYYVANTAEGTDNETAVTGVSEFNLSAGTWYINAATSEVQFTKIEFLAPKCEKPVFNALTNSDICSGDLYVALDGTATVTDGGTVTYKWYAEDGTEVLAETETYTPTADGSYYVVATNSLEGYTDNVATSEIVTVTTHTSAAITSAPENVRMDAGQAATLTVEASGKNLTYQWYTCDDAAGTNSVEVSGATDASLNVIVPEGVQYYKVVVSSDCGAPAEAVAKVEKWVAVAQADVTESITWDWTKAASVDEIKLTEETTPAKNEGIVMANGGSTIYNNEDFESDKLYIEGEYIVRYGKYFQGQTIKFKTTVEGLVRVTFSNTGGNPARELYVNNVGTGVSSANATMITTGYVEVPAGEVSITAYLQDKTEDAKQKYVRVSKIEFLALGYTRDVNVGELATVCLPNACVARDVEVYELVGKEPQYGKIVFDEILSGELMAGKPYLLRVTNPKAKFYYTVDAPAAEPNNSGAMKGTFVDMTLTDLTNIYYFAQKALWSCVDLTKLTVPANRAYVNMAEMPDASTSNPAPGVRRVTLGVNGQNVTTGVENVDASTQPTKVLINGQLFILRGEKMYDATGKLVK